MDFNSFVLGIVICFLLSFCLGLERQIRKRNVGLRTIILVAVGSYVFVSFSFLVTGYSIDISRIASQVVAGIGFLGAGVIIKNSEQGKIKGLTTAATLWCDAGIGILCAAGYIKEATVVTILVLFSNIILRYVNSFINSKVEEKNTNEEYLISLNEVVNYNKILDGLRNYKISIKNYSVDKKNVNIYVTFRKNEDSNMNKYISKLLLDNGVSSYSINKLSEEKINEVDDEL